MPIPGSSASPEKRREYQKKSYDKSSQRNIAYRQSPNGKLAGYKGNAKTRGLVWGLTSDQSFDMFAACCHWCGKECCNGIDRLDSNLGYIVSNCVPSCGVCNVAKNDLSVAEFLKWIEAVHSHQQSKILGSQGV